MQRLPITQRRPSGGYIPIPTLLKGADFFVSKIWPLMVASGTAYGVYKIVEKARE